MGLFHITSQTAWAAAQAAGEYRPSSLAAEGFVHLSGDKQWWRTANRFFRGQHGLVLLSIDPARLTAPVRFEVADGEEFPHLYGPLNVDAVVEVSELPVGADGEIGIPPWLELWRPYFTH